MRVDTNLTHLLILSTVTTQFDQTPITLNPNPIANLYPQATTP